MFKNKEKMFNTLKTIGGLIIIGLIIYCIIWMYIRVTQPRFDEDFIPTIYTSDDVYYNINKSEEQKYKVSVSDILKEKGKEDIYVIYFEDESDPFRNFNRQISKSEYENNIGEGNNIVTCNYTELHLILPCEDSKEFKSLLYERNIRKYSFEDDYVVYNDKNIKNDIEQFIYDITLTEEEQFKEYDDVNTDEYLVDVYFKFKGFSVNDSYCNRWGEQNLKEKLYGFTQYKD